MKNLIFALVAIMYGMCAVNAGEVQDSWCDDKSLSYCIEHFDRQCESKIIMLVALWEVYI